MRPEKVFAARRILGRFRGIHRHPADALGVEFRPAVIPPDLSCAARGGQREADGEPGRNADSARIADEDGVEVGAIAAPVFARIVDVAAAPSLAALVVLHGGHYVVVNGARLLEIGLRARGGDHFVGPGSNLAVEWHQAVRFHPARQILRRLFVHGAGRGGEFLAMLAARGFEAQRHTDRIARGPLQAQVQDAVPDLIHIDPVGDGRSHLKVLDALVRVVVRNRHPQVHLAGSGRERADRGRVFHGDASAMLSLGGEHGERDGAD